MSCPTLFFFKVVFELWGPLRSHVTFKMSFSLFKNCTYFFMADWTFTAVCELFSSCSKWGLLSSFGVRASCCGGFSCCRS